MNESTTQKNTAYPYFSVKFRQYQGLHGFEESASGKPYYKAFIILFFFSIKSFITQYSSFSNIQSKFDERNWWQLEV